MFSRWISRARVSWVPTPLVIAAFAVAALACGAGCFAPRMEPPPPIAPDTLPGGVAAGASGSSAKEGRFALEGRSFSIELQVSEPSGLERRSEPVLASVPFPREAGVRDGSELCVLTEAGVPLPVQAHVLSRWDARPDDTSKPARWVLLQFETDVAASRIQALHLVRRTLDQRPEKPVHVEVKDRHATLDTGTIRVALGGAGLMEGITASGGEALAGKGDALLRLGQGSETIRAEAPDSVEVLEAGPVRGVVRLTGHYAAGAAPATSNGSPALGYALTVEGWAGRSELRLSLETRNSDPHTKRTVELSELSFALALAHPVESTSSPEGTRPLASSDALVLEQGPRVKGGTPSFTLGLEGGARVAEGKESEGWLVASGGGVSCEAALRRPVDRAPSGIRVAPSGLVLRFVTPERPGHEGPIFQRWLGDLQQRTDAALLVFGASDPAAAVRAWKAPLLGQPHASWVRDAGGFLGPIADESDEAQALNACALDPDPRASLRRGSKPDARPDAFIGEVNVKWDTESDEARDLLVRWVRTGDRAAFDEGAAWVDFFRDRYVPRTVGFTFAESETRTAGPSSGPAAEAQKRLDVSRLKESHVYGEGLVAHYLLTGDRASLEAAQDIAKLAAARFSKVEPQDKILEQRVFARPMQTLAALVEVTGDEAARQLLERMVANAAASATRDLGRGCYAFYLYVGEFDLDALLPKGLSLPEKFPGDASKGLFQRGPRWIKIKGERAAFPYQDRELAHALARDFEITHDEKARQALIGMATYYLDEGLVPIFYAPEKTITPYYTLPYVAEPSVARYWQPSSPLYSTNLGLIESAAYLASGDMRFLEQAKKCLRIACLRAHGDDRPIPEGEHKIRVPVASQWGHGWDDTRTFVALGAKGALPRPAAVRDVVAKPGSKPGTVDLRFAAGDEKAVRWIVLGSKLTIVDGPGDGEKTVGTFGATPLVTVPAKGTDATVIVPTPGGERSFVVFAEAESGALAEVSNVATMN